jgi:hypothetical protein
MIDRDLVASGISEKELEIEHLTTQVLALTEKVDVIEDIQKDAQASKQMLSESESKRAELQDNIQQTNLANT